MKEKKDVLLNVLVIRFSAFGDVAMTLPALYSAAKAHPNHTFYMLTSKNFEGLFANQLPNIKVIGVDLKLYKGVKGLLQLANEINKNYKIDIVADLHSVLRSQVIRSYFFLRGKKVKSIFKDRAKKKAIVKHKAPLTQLKHSIDRYRDVFSKLGLKSEMSFKSYFENKTRNVAELNNLSFDVSKSNIGIAPFAMHVEKMYPIDKMEEVLKEIIAKDNTHVYLFGGGKKEKQKFEEWEAKYPNVTSVIGMSETDARMAFERHATSKIQQATDLFALTTMGFRGEALPSISAIAQLEIKTRTNDREVGTLIKIAGSQVESQEPVSKIGRAHV